VTIYVYHDYPYTTFSGVFYAPIHIVDRVVRYSFWRAERPPAQLP
jgi:hypothetical protein